jgi:Raf kinase inhibitor-like YbhB/YbcL family protein
MIRACIASLIAVLLIGCGRGGQSDRDSAYAGPSPAPATAPTTTDSISRSPTVSLDIKSSAFTANGSIPARYTCEGDDVSPPLSWSGAPSGTKSFALIVDDPDAPDPAKPKMVYVHWVVFNIPASASSFTENASKKGLPAGAVQGKNDWGKAQYGGPCPPIGRHRYFFKLYALDRELSGLSSSSTKPDVLKAIEGHILANGELVGTYQKANK